MRGEKLASRIAREITTSRLAKHDKEIEKSHGKDGSWQYKQATEHMRRKPYT